MDVDMPGDFTPVLAVGVAKPALEAIAFFIAIGASSRHLCVGGRLLARSALRHVAGVGSCAGSRVCEN